VSRRALGLGLLLAVAPAAAAQSPEPARYEGWTWAEHPPPPPLAADTMRTPPDRWLARDKALHAGGSFALTLSTHLALTEGAGATEAEALPLAAGTALFLGVMKEVSDSYRSRRPGFSWRDLTADAVGVLLAAGAVALW